MFAGKPGGFTFNFNMIPLHPGDRKTVTLAPVIVPLNQKLAQLPREALNSRGTAQIKITIFKT